MYSISKVRELAETLERSLSFGSAVKKPAGGVSLHFQETGDKRSQPQRTFGQRSSKQVWDVRHFVFVQLIVFSLLTCLLFGLSRMTMALRVTSPFPRKTSPHRAYGTHYKSKAANP